MPNPHSGNPFAAGQDRLRQGLELQKQGRLAEAEKLYLQVLAQQPRNPAVLHFLGVLALQMQQPERGIKLIGEALAIQPSYALAHGSLGKGLEALGRREEAVASYGRAIALMPGQAEAFYNRGRNLETLGRLEEALNDYNQAMTLRPVPAVALDRGVTLMKLQRTQDAIASFDRAIAMRPNYPVAYYNRGLALMALKQPEAALASYDQAIAQKPDYAEAFINRGLALEELSRPDEALASYDRGLALNPDLGHGYLNRGSLLAKLRRNEEALACYDDAIARRPDFALAHNNRGNMLRSLNSDEKALAEFDKAVALAPDTAQLHSNRGLAQHNMKQHDEALASFDRAIALDPSYAETYFNKSLALLMTGQFEQGWRHYEWRKKLSPPVGLRLYPQPLWLGEEDISGKTLFAYWEQGLGDTIQFCRYAELAHTRGANVILSVQDRLVRLLRDLAPVANIIGADLMPEQFDYHIPLGSMPLAFRSDLNTIPATVPYLTAETERIRQWQARIGEGGFKIGICWQGNRQGNIDVGRSMPLALFQGIARIPDVRLISLQKSDGAEQLNSLPLGMQVETLGDDFDVGPDAFVDTAAVMANLDLIITTDTSIAHLAGALGRPTWLPLRFASEWRWLLERTDSPWYPTMTIFRQTANGDWDGVFATMTQTLWNSQPLALKFPNG